ncbi:S1 family peptidase [Flagellimonas iocasae]|uniref:Serine protease n=1 Tax=Flagellimonas iocasae TaxID=2055905 RepID=A0ABW4XUS7_9FLAO
MEPRKVRVDKLSYVSIPISMYLDETKQKLASGTGFIYERNKQYYLVTNWHNFTGLNPETKKSISRHGGIPNVVTFSLLIQEKPHIQWKEFGVNLYENNKAQWLVHPDHKHKIDVAAIEIEIDSEQEIILKPLNKIEFDDIEPKVADDIFILGFPYSLKGGGRFPIWKRGSIATEPDLHIDSLPKFLVDTAGKSGMSGSPVIFRRSGIHGVVGGKVSLDSILGTVENFVGIYSGRIIGKSELDAQLGIVWKKEVIDQIIDGNCKDEIKFA